MLKKALLSAALLVFVFLASGCGTLYKGASGLVHGIKEGAKEDWAWAVKSDEWIKDNLW